MSDQETIPPQTADRGTPESPFELPAPDWKESLKRAAREFKADRGSMTSAGMAFYWFLAIFPSVLAAVGFIGLVHASPDFVTKLSKGITSAMPGSAAEVLTSSLEKATNQSTGSSGVAALFGTALALWSASAGMVALQTGLDVVYDVEEDRTFIKARARALVLIVAAALLGGLATVLIVFGQPLGEALRDNVPFGGAFVLLWTLIRWVLGIGALTALFASFYYLAPNRESPRWSWLSPGGVVATAIWLAASLGFSFYVSSFGSYARTYGSLTGVVVLMLWLYLSAMAVVLGGEINAELERQGEQRRRQKRGRRRRRRPEGQQAQAPQRPPAAEVPARSRGPDGGGPPASQPSSYETEWMERMRQLRQDAGSDPK